MTELEKFVFMGFDQVKHNLCGCFCFCFFFTFITENMKNANLLMTEDVRSQILVPLQSVVPLQSEVFLTFRCTTDGAKPQTKLSLSVESDSSSCAKEGGIKLFKTVLLF